MEHLQRSSEGDEQRLTVADYATIIEHHAVSLGDWIFKVPPFSGPSNDEAYVDYARSCGVESCDLATAAGMKTCVPGFLDTAAADLLSGRPRIVGFSTVFQQNIASLVLAKRLKELDPSLTIIFGGDNCDGPMGVALHASFPWVDIVVRGEGEHVLVALAEDLLNGRSIRPQPGLCYRERGQGCGDPARGSAAIGDGRCARACLRRLLRAAGEESSSIGAAFTGGVAVRKALEAAGGARNRTAPSCGLDRARP